MTWTNDYRKGNPNERGRLSFYVFDDLTARQHGDSPVICYYDDVEQALGAYRFIAATHSRQVVALGGELGGGALDFVHRYGDRDVLIGDYALLGSWANNSDVQKAVRKIALELGLEDKSLDKLRERAAERSAEKNAGRPHPGKAKDFDLER